MLLQPLQSRNAHLSLGASYAQPLPFKPVVSVRFRSTNYGKSAVVCSISQIHSYGTVHYERSSMIQWISVYKKISLMENPELGPASVLNQWEKHGRKFTKWELYRVVKELRKYKRHKQALEVYDWMNNRGERFRLSASDAAIQLDLIAKVRGISNSEDFFLRLPDRYKDKRVYGALLNAYVSARLREKAETLIEKMKQKGYANHPLPYNVMMTLYMNLKEYDKVEKMVMEMKDRRIRFDIYSYNIWLSSCGSERSLGKMEQAFEQMKLDRTINPNWTTFSTMATMYIKMGEFEKATDALRKVEARITGKDRTPYHYLLSLYGAVGNKDEINRVWRSYRAVFPSIPNLGYHAMMSSLVRIGDIEGAEKIYDEWLPVQSSYDPRVANLLMGAYIKNKDLDKAESFFDRMIELGGKPNSSTWEILAEGHIGERRVQEALSCLKAAFAAEGSKSWRPKTTNVSRFFQLCEEESDGVSKDVLLGMLRKSGYLQDKTYCAVIGLLDGDDMYDELVGEKDGKLDEDGNESDGSELVLFAQLQGSL